MTGAMYAAVSGLRSHMSKLNVIGHNIANVNTYAYKSQRMTFEESIYSTSRAGANSAGTTTGGVNPSQYGFGANVSSIDLKMATSTYSPTGYGMDCMIDGDGFFLVGDKTVNVTGIEDVSKLQLTRMGDFNVSDEGYIRDSRGQILYGFMYVQNPNYNPKLLEDGEMMSAEDAETYKQDNPTWNDEFILSTDLVPLRLPLAAEAPTLANGGIDENGESRWEEGDAVFPVLQPTSSEEGEEWLGATNMEPTTDTNEIPVGGTEPVVTYPGAEDDGTEPTGGVNDGELGYGSSMYPVNGLNKAVALEGLSINSSGLITGINKDTGEEVVVGYAAIASVDNSAGVTHQGGPYYKALGGAGDIRVSVLGGAADGKYFGNQYMVNPDDDEEINQTLTLLDAILGGSNTSLVNGGLEASNCDLAVEFSEMITTQRGYQANTRVVTVTDGMLEELVNMKR